MFVVLALRTASMKCRTCLYVVFHYTLPNRVNKFSATLHNKSLHRRIGCINLKSQVKQSSDYREICLTIRRRAWMERARRFLTLGLENSGGIQLETSEEER
jgi:hypothetical protein